MKCWLRVALDDPKDEMLVCIALESPKGEMLVCDALNDPKGVLQDVSGMM